MARYFTPDFVERAVLRDGTVVRMRLTAPEDKALLRRSFERWSPESRYARFLVPKQRLSDEELDYLCDVDQEQHFSLGAVAEEGDGHGEPVGLGIARFIVLRSLPGEPPIAEAAIAVADEAAGKGLGRLLFLRLCAAARERGIERFRCEVLCSNRSMQALIAAIAPAHTTVVHSGVTTIDFDIPPVAPDAASTDTSSPLYQFFRAAAEGAIEWTEAVRRFWRR